MSFLPHFRNDWFIDAIKVIFWHSLPCRACILYTYACCSSYLWINMRYKTANDSCKHILLLYCTVLVVCMRVDLYYSTFDLCILTELQWKCINNIVDNKTTDKIIYSQRKQCLAIVCEHTQFSAARKFSPQNRLELTGSCRLHAAWIYYDCCLSCCCCLIGAWFIRVAISYVSHVSFSDCTHSPNIIIIY